jgi:hypothetical protein
MSFEFKGDWEFEYQFEAFKGFQSRRGAYTSRNSNKESDGVVKVTIVDELNDETDPTDQQLAAINFIIENPQKIQALLFESLEIEYPKLKEVYGYSVDDDDSRERFPKIGFLDEFRKVFGVGSMFVLTSQKEGFAYIGLECGCAWDEEHGLGFLLHKDRLVKIGSADQALNSWDAFEDNGTFEKEQQKWKKHLNERENLPRPKIYEPNPKYGQLKPTQIAANKMYENYLIERGYNAEFRKLVEIGKVNINVNPGLSMTFLERAAQFNNLEIVKFILSKGPQSKRNAIHNSVGHCNKELVEILLENGVNINELDHSGRTILSLTEQRISVAARNSNAELNRYQDFALWLRSKGAH